MSDMLNYLLLMITGTRTLWTRVYLSIQILPVVHPTCELLSSLSLTRLPALVGFLLALVF